jgi:hypothetical protein
VESIASPHDRNQAEQVRTIFSEKERKGIMKKYLFILIILGMFFILTRNGAVYGEDTSYGTPWIDSSRNLYDLIKEGYTIVGLSVTTPALAGAVIEVIYVQKEKKLYRCFSIESKEKTQHMCNYLTEPKKTN